MGITQSAHGRAAGARDRQSTRALRRCRSALGGGLAGLTLLVLITGGSACKSERAVQTNVDPTSEETMDSEEGGVPDDFRMVFGQGGGFSGFWNGYAIEADGQVTSWTGRTQEADTLASGRLEPADLADLWRRVQEVGVLDRIARDTGNMTAFIELTAEGRSRRVSWVPGAEGVEPPVSDLDALYRHSLGVARAAVEQ